MKTRATAIVVTMPDGHRKSPRELVERLRAQHRDRVLHTEIPWTTSIADAAGARQHVFAFAPKSAGADAFRRLAGEVLHRLPSIRH